MTEEEWLAGASPEPMLRFFWANESDRKLRLFAVACARRVTRLSTSGFWQRQGSPKANERLAVAERFADGAGATWELEAAWDAGANSRVLGAAPARWRAEDYAEAAAGDACDSDASDAALWAMLNGQSAVAPDAKEDLSGHLPEGPEHRPQVCLLRDIFGNPFRPVTLDPACLTPAVLALAQAAYDERHLPSGELDPDRLAVLADALEDVGAAGDILTHLRLPGPHVRGCWALDLVLGKS